MTKLLVIGHARHGKDTVCDLLYKKYKYSFESSSRFCSKFLLYPQLKDMYGYKSEEECYADRHNHRAEWFELISAYNSLDPARLGKAIFDNYDIYCGLRNIREFYAMKQQNVIDYTVWVDRSKFLPEESKESMTITKDCADFVIDNNGTLQDLEKKVDDFVEHLKSLTGD